MSDPLKDSRTRSVLIDLAATFVNAESNNQSLITVTDVVVEDGGREARILITVLPDSATDGALSFLKRKRGIFREYLKEKSRLPRIPFVDFVIDRGEKNRQRVDELTSK